MESGPRSHKPNPVAAIPLAVLAFIAIYACGKYVRGLIYGFPDPLGLHSPLPSPAPVSSASPSPAPQASARATGLRGAEEAWAAFNARFGPGLKSEPGSGGRLSAIRGAPGSGASGRGDFSPENSEHAIARAREVLDSARGLLGIEPGLPLGEPSAKTGPVSAQVYFPETLAGVPLEPVGSVSVDLGPRGEILGVSSSYVGGITTVNQRNLSADQAKAKAEAAVPASSTGLSTLGGNAIVWVTHTGPGGAPEGHQAFEYNVDGRQIVVDAGNGQVLFKRDRRQF